MSQRVRQALRRIPGWQDALISELPGGLSNRTWLLTAEGKKAVLKVDAAPRGAPFNARLAEREVQEAAAAHGLANRVWYADECTILTEYVDGQVWTPSDLTDGDKLQLLARLLRELHALPLTGRSFDANKVAKIYIEQIDVANAAVARHCVNSVARLHAPQQRCCCHNDLVAENIIATPGLRLLDWEYACDNDPLFDLAVIVAHHDLSDDTAMHLLNAYFDGHGERWYKSLQRHVRVYNALTWLWYAARPGYDPEQLAVFEQRLG